MFFGFQKFDNVSNFEDIEIDQHTSNFGSEVFVFGKFLNHGVEELSQHSRLFLFVVLCEFLKVFFQRLNGEFGVGFGLGSRLLGGNLFGSSILVALLAVKVLSSKVLASVLGVLLSLPLSSHGAHSSGSSLSEHALHGESLHGHRLHHHHEHNHGVHGLVSSVLGLSDFGKFIVLVLVLSDMVVNVDLSTVVKGFDSLVSLAFLEGSLGLFRVFEFDKSEFGIDLDLVFKDSVVLFGLSDGDFLGIDGSELFEGFDKLFDGGLFFEVFGEQVGVVSELGVFFLSGLFILEPANVKFGSTLKEIGVFVGGHNFFGGFFVSELDKGVGISSLFLESDNERFDGTSVLGESVFEFFFNVFF